MPTAAVVLARQLRDVQGGSDMVPVLPASASTLGSDRLARRRPDDDGTGRP
ncbi:hypothetical protein [Georgenia yuyongxinii]